MRYFSALLALLLLGTAIHAGPKNYGKSLTLKETTRISDIYAQPQKYAGKRVLVEGPIVNVCKKRGCWIEIVPSKARASPHDSRSWAAGMAQWARAVVSSSE